MCPACLPFSSSSRHSLPAQCTPLPSYTSFKGGRAGEGHRQTHKLWISHKCRLCLRVTFMTLQSRKSFVHSMFKCITIRPLNYYKLWLFFVISSHSTEESHFLCLRLRLGKRRSYSYVWLELRSAPPSGQRQTGRRRGGRERRPE